MNEMDFRMDFNERRDVVIEKITEVIQDDTDIFVSLCEELDNWNGFLGDARCVDMYEIDEYFTKPSDLLSAMDSFDKDDEYFYFDGWGNVTTASDKFDVYSDEIDIDELVDDVIDNYNHIDINDTTLRELVEIVINEDFGIEEDWEYNEDMDECDMPEETDDEFMDRINNI